MSAADLDAEPALAAAAVTVRFGGVTALQDVSFGLHRGETCGVIGPNGAGKTTLFDVLSGVRQPTSGTVCIAGRGAPRGAARVARLGVRRTFQRQQMFGWLSVRDNVLVALESEGGGGGLLADVVRLPTRTRRERERRQRVDEALELCGLGTIADQPAGSLDIGRSHLVELARAVVARPAVLLLDEPTSGLEGPEAAQLGAIVETLRADHRCAIAIVEHDVEFIVAHSQRIVVLHLGQVIADGTPDAVRAMPDVQSAYLGAV